MNIFKKILNGLLDWKENRPIAGWLVRLAKNYRKYIFAFLLINLLTMGISLGSAVAGKYVVDATTGDQWVPIVIMLVTSLVSITISSLSSMFASYMGEKLSFGIRAQLYDRVQRSVWHKLSKYRSGDLMSRLAGDVDTISGGASIYLPATVRGFAVTFESMSGTLINEFGADHFGTRALPIHLNTISGSMRIARL